MKLFVKIVNNIKYFCKKQKVLYYMFDMVLNTLKGFTALFLALEHLKYCLNTQSLKGICVILWWFHCCFLLKFYLINYLESLLFPLTQPWKQWNVIFLNINYFKKIAQKCDGLQLCARRMITVHLKWILGMCWGVCAITHLFSPSLGAGTYLI